MVSWCNLTQVMRKWCHSKPVSAKGTMGLLKLTSRWTREQTNINTHSTGRHHLLNVLSLWLLRLDGLKD